MPKTKSAKRNLKKALKRKMINDQWRKAIKMAISQFKEAVEVKNKEEAYKWLREIYKRVDKAGKRFLHKNKVARLKSKYAKIFASKFS